MLAAPSPVRLHPAGTPAIVTLSSVSSPSKPVSEMIANGIVSAAVLSSTTAGSAWLNHGASAASVTDTAKLIVATAVSKPVGPAAVSLAVTDSVKLSASTSDGATNTRPPRPPEPAVQVPP